MTKLLEQAIVAASNLAPEDQDAVASLILAELDAEEKWQEALTRDPGKLAKLADEALEEIRAGRSKPLDIDEI